MFTFAAVCQVLFVARHLASRRRSYFKFSPRTRFQMAEVFHFGGFGAPQRTSSSGLARGADAASADQVQIWNGTDHITYYYNTTAGGWRSAKDASTNAAATSIPYSSSIIVRRFGSSAFTWIMLQHPSSL